MDRPTPETFATTGDADDWLAEQQVEVRGGDWRDPAAGAVNFKAYAVQWIEERGLPATTDELYRRLLRLHILPTFGAMDLDEARVFDLGVRRGAGDENRTRALSLGITVRASLDGRLTCKGTSLRCVCFGIGDPALTAADRSTWCASGAVR